MADEPPLISEARLDARAAATVRALPEEARESLQTAWEGALRAQERELDRAIEGSLSLLPRLVRGQVLRLLRRGRS